MDYILMAIPVLAIVLYSLYLYHYSKKSKKFGRMVHDISMDDILNCEYRLRLFLDRNHLDMFSPELLTNIASILNVKESQTEFASFGKQATLEEQKKKNGKIEYIVKYKKDLPDDDKPFYLAHELGHLILLHNLPAARSEGHNRKETEQLADYMAAAILMPAESVYGYLKKNDPSYDEALAYLITTYKVNSDIAARRLVEIADLDDRRFFFNPSEQKS